MAWTITLPLVVQMLGLPQVDAPTDHAVEQAMPPLAVHDVELAFLGRISTINKTRMAAKQEGCVVNSAFHAETDRSCIATLAAEFEWPERLHFYAVKKVLLQDFHVVELLSNPPTDCNQIIGTS